eukprot:NODE_26_length_35450_cov_0.398320.p29 type:complete len:108 gc:universal NODE_26_length_35450_cov_0.398320:14241-14564(+)
MLFMAGDSFSTELVMLSGNENPFVEINSRDSMYSVWVWTTFIGYANPICQSNIVKMNLKLPNWTKILKIVLIINRDKHDEIEVLFKSLSGVLQPFSIRHHSFNNERR